MKNGKAIITAGLLFSAGSTLAPGAGAALFDDATVTPILGVTTSTLDYRRAAASDNRQTSVNSLSLTLGVSGEKWYGRFNAEWPMTPGVYLAGSSVQDIKRTDYSLSVGYPITPRLSAYAGYLHTLTVMTSSTWLENQVDSGPFAGISLELYRGDSSSFAANIAYASLAGSATREPIVFDVRGPTTGLSYGLSWTGQLGRDGRSYVLSYKIQDFRFEGSGTGGPQTIDKDYSVLTFGIIL